MTTSKYEESIKELNSTDNTKRLKALRFIKNTVIGNKTKKDLYIKLGVVQKLVDYLCAPEEIPFTLKIQSATILGSIAYGKDDNVSTVITSSAVTPLLDSILISSDKSILETIHERRKLIEASTRALKAIFTVSSPDYPKYYWVNGNHVSSLVSILKITSGFLMDESYISTSSEGLSFSMIAESTAVIVSKCCDTTEEQTRLKNANVIQPLVDILHSKCIKAQEASLEALGSLCHENSDLGEFIIASKSTNQGQSTLNTILDFTKGKCPKMRLIACTCLTNLYRTGVFPGLSNDIIIIVLPALVKLLQETTGDIQEKAPLIIADLIKDSDEMQNAAYETDAISRLAELLASVSTDKEDTPSLGIPGSGSIVRRKEKIKENTLIAIAAATLIKEECRTQAIKAKVLPHVMSGIHSDRPNVRLAACQCAKSLSRSVSHLRTSFIDANIAPPLVKLLHDESITVQAAACGVLCNLALEFSPMKASLIESDAVKKFVEYSKSEHATLKINGVWAINNVLFKADLKAKKSVMTILTFDALLELLHDSNRLIQEKALDIVRNLVYGAQEDVDWVYRNIGKDDLLDVIESKLQAMEIDEKDGASTSLTLKPTLYIIVNMCSNAEAPKMDIMKRDAIVKNVVSLLSHDDAGVRTAATWALVNWTWKDAEDSKENLLNRCNCLIELGVKDKLEVLIEEDSCRDVRDRAKTALTQLSDANT